MLKAPLRILIVTALCVAALIGLVVNESAARAGGREVLLPMEAVDPRSLLHGHYVELRMTQFLEAGEVCPSGQENARWLALHQADAVHVIAGGAATRADAAAIAPLVVRGSFTCTEPMPDPMVESQGWLELDIGIDRFHINQTDALRIEAVLREATIDEQTRAFAIVSIGDDGRARLKDLLIDGERLELTWL